MKQKQRLLMMLVMGLAPFIYASAQTDTLTINASNFKTYLEYKSGNNRWQFKNHANLASAKKIIIDGLPQNTVVKVNNKDTTVNVASIWYANNPQGLLAYLEKVELKDGHYLATLYISGTKLKKAYIGKRQNMNNMSLSIDQTGTITQTDITFHPDIKIQSFLCRRNRITSLEPFYNYFCMEKPEGAGESMGVQFNGGKYYRKTQAGVDDGTINPTNQIREIDMTKIPSWWYVFLIRHNLLDRLTNVNHPNLKEIEINNNLMWSADLSSVTPVTTAQHIGPQKPVADLTVVKGAAVDGSGDEVRLYLPEGQSALFDNSRLVSGSVKLLGNAVATQAIQGTATEKYFKVASVANGQKADLDLYNKHNGFTYQYNTRPAVTDATIASLGVDATQVRDMQIEIKTYPYIMYIHPATKSGKGVEYYSGTLWLDYDAIVPEGTTVWIATDINKDSVTTTGTSEAKVQLSLEMIGEPGDLIPAGTAMYVRSDTKAGLYDFQKAWTHELVGWDGTAATSQKEDTLVYNQVLTTDQQNKLAAQRELIGDRNLLEGYATETVLPNKYEALILGIESKKGTGMIGFWPFNGTTIRAHRCFISEATYRRVTGDSGSAKGVTFFFNDPETTGIKVIDNGQAKTDNDAWYTIDGKRLTVKPTQKGIYIHKGRKEVIR